MEDRFYMLDELGFSEMVEAVSEIVSENDRISEVDILPVRLDTYSGDSFSPFSNSPDERINPESWISETNELCLSYCDSLFIEARLEQSPINESQTLTVLYL